VRTTLELDDDLLAAAKELAKTEGVTLGRLISDLARQSLRAKSTPAIRNGVPLLTPKKNAPKPTLRLVNRLRDEI